MTGSPGTISQECTGRTPARSALRRTRGSSGSNKGAPPGSTVRATPALSANQFRMLRNNLLPSTAIHCSLYDIRCPTSNPCASMRILEFFLGHAFPAGGTKGVRCFSDNAVTQVLFVALRFYRCRKGMRRGESNGGRLANSQCSSLPSFQHSKPQWPKRRGSYGVRSALTSLRRPPIVERVWYSASIRIVEMTA